jgi:hypothetical protein
LAVLPNGTQKLLQYVVAPGSALTVPNLSFPSAFTVLGTNIFFDGATDKQFQAEGNDQVKGGNCNPVQLPVPAIGVPTDAEVGNVVNGGNGGNGIPVPYRSNYDGLKPAPPASGPSVMNVAQALPMDLQTPAALDSLVQKITQNADAVLTGPVDSYHLPSAMSAANPMTVVVNGDFVLYNGVTGYGLLVVTGKFSYTGDAGWKGVVLVIGKGSIVGSNEGSNEFDGALLVANTRDSSGNLLPSFGQAKIDLPAAGGNGVYYNSCWVASALPTVSYKILSFHEIPQP